MYRWRAFGQSCWRRIKAAIQIFERLQTRAYIKFDQLVSNYILKKQWLRLSLGTIEYATNTYKKILLHIQNKSKYIYLRWKENGTALLLRKVQSKFADFFCFHHYMKCGYRSAHTACGEGKLPYNGKNTWIQRCENAQKTSHFPYARHG